MADKEKKTETEAQKFTRITNKKVNVALSALRTLANCAQYSPTTEQRDKVFTTLQEEMKRAHTAWTQKKAPAGAGFAL